MLPSIALCDGLESLNPWDTRRDGVVAMDREQHRAGGRKGCLSKPKYPNLSYTDTCCITSHLITSPIKDHRTTT